MQGWVSDRHGNDWQRRDPWSTTFRQSSKKIRRPRVRDLGGDCPRRGLLCGPPVGARRACFQMTQTKKIEAELAYLRAAKLTTLGVIGTAQMNRAVIEELVIPKAMVVDRLDAKELKAVDATVATADIASLACQAATIDDLDVPKKLVADEAAVTTADVSFLTSRRGTIDGLDVPHELLANEAAIASAIIATATVKSANVLALASQEATIDDLAVPHKLTADEAVVGTSTLSSATIDSANIRSLSAADAVLQKTQLDGATWSNGPLSLSSSMTLQQEPLWGNPNPTGLYYMSTLGLPYVREPWTAKVGGEETNFFPDTNHVRIVGSDVCGFIEMKIIAIGGDPDYVRGTFYLGNQYYGMHLGKSKKGTNAKLRMNVMLSANAYSACDPKKTVPFAQPIVEWAGLVDSPANTLAVQVYWKPATTQKSNNVLKDVVKVIKDILWEDILASSASPDGLLGSSSSPGDATKAWEDLTDQEILDLTGMPKAGSAEDGTLYFYANGSSYNCLRFCYNICIHDGVYSKGPPSL